MSAPASASQAQNPNAAPEIIRRSANYSPSIWGDHFLSYSSLEVDIKLEQQVKELKAKVKNRLVALGKKPSEKLGLIDDIQRLGVSYHFENEIDEILQEIHNSSSEGDEDLYTVALRFRLLRQHRYNVSCDIFNKFKDGDGKFKETLLQSDVRGLLSLYEATHLRTYGEDTLEEALIFTTAHLELAVQHPATHPLSEQVRHALYQPLWQSLPRLEARHNLSIFEELYSHDQTLLTFAKLDFNLLQQVHQKELCELTRWWKDLDTANKLPFARDRLVECYFWSVGVCYEPEYYISRRLLAKIITIASVIDDVYDLYATLDELVLFTEAIERWDISTKDQLPEYMQVCYQILLGAYSEVEGMLANEGRLYRMDYAKESFKLLARAYFQESTWYHQKYTPTLEEYKAIGLVTSGQKMFAATLFIGMRDIVTKDTYDWLFSNPKILMGSKAVSRFMDDVVSHKFEQEKGDVPSSVECYMIENIGATEEEAENEIRKLVSNAWKDMNGGWIHPPRAIPKSVLVRILNLARVIDVMYKCEDGYTKTGSELKGFVSTLLDEKVAA